MTRTCTSRGRRPVLSLALASACACAAVALVPREAQAANYGRFDLGIDGDLTAVVHQNAPTGLAPNTLGSGFKLRFGDNFRYRNGVDLTPEVGFAYDRLFPGSDTNEIGTGQNMERVFGGVRLGFGRWVIPTAYAHLGYGFQEIATPAGSAIAAGTNGLTLDVGAAVEFRIARHLSFGPHAEYVYMNVAGTPQWLAFGAHLDLLF